ncbi:MAG TPA: phospholipase [Vicinamibacteria bacterium]|nr:phospholipase [Vicinamibacteria bacterium]
MSEVRARALAARIHGRYLVRPPAGNGRGPLLVGFHGYGEAAEAHLEQLERIPGARDLALVAVQSLHLFYTKAGDVVGSWMTKLEREHAIADNVAYVAQVVARVREELPRAGPLVFAGFSQGVSMAYRAAAHSGHPCAGLMALGGDMPPDVSEDEGARLPPALVARGEGDHWFTAEKMERDLARLRARGVPVRPLVFAGGHEWSPAFHSAAAEFLGSLGVDA